MVTFFLDPPFEKKDIHISYDDALVMGHGVLDTQNPYIVIYAQTWLAEKSPHNTFDPLMASDRDIEVRLRLE